MSQPTTIPPIVNQLMKFILRSPAHGIVSSTVTLITFTGRKTGQTYTTPVSYSQTGDLVTIFTHAQWWKNLCGGPLTASGPLMTSGPLAPQAAPVTLRIRGHNFQGLAEPVAGDQPAIAAGLTEHLRRVPSDARYYSVTFDDHGNPNADEIKKAVQTVVMIRVRLC